MNPSGEEQLDDAKENCNDTNHDPAHEFASSTTYLVSMSSKGVVGGRPLLERRLYLAGLVGLIVMGLALVPVFFLQDQAVFLFSRPRR